MAPSRTRFGLPARIALPTTIRATTRTPFLQVAKTAAAMIIAWGVAWVLLPGELPVFATIAALLVVQPSVNQSVGRAIERSLCFGVYEGTRQLGFARVVTDGAGFAYLGDVFVVDAARGRGIGKRLMEFVFAHPDLGRVRRFMLATRDAHGLYAQYGFTPLANPEKFMERYDPDALSR